MIQDIEERRHKAFEFLQRLYEKTVGENDRMKYVNIAEISHELEMFPAQPTDVLSEEEKNELYEQGKGAEEVVLRLREQGLVKLVGHPNPYYGGQVYITQRGIDEVETTIIKGKLSDNELRGIVLEKFYDERDKDYVPINKQFFGSAISQATLFRISEQLGEQGLIIFKPLRGDDEIKSAKGKTTSSGVDVIERVGKNTPTIIRGELTAFEVSQEPQGPSALNVNLTPKSIPKHKKPAHTIKPRAIRVFLCHSFSDKLTVRELHNRLINDGVDSWLDDEKLLPGQDWEFEIKKAVRSSDVVIVCLSSTATMRAGYVQKEIKFALDVAEEQPEGLIFIIPLRLEECAVPERLQRWHWVDLFETEGYERLKRALDKRAGRVES